MVSRSRWLLSRFGYTRQQLLDLIASCGAYDFYFLNVGGRELTPLTADNIDRMDGDYTDVLAKPA